MTDRRRNVRLGRLFRRKKVLGYVDEQMLSIYREHGVVVKNEQLNPNRTAEDRSIYQLVEPGWLVVNRMKAWQGSIGISSLRGIVSGHYICFAPTHSEDDRYLHYTLRSPAYTAHFAAISRGVRPGQIEIDNDELAATELSPAAQRRIADFLDDQVARIDNIIAARRSQIYLLRIESQYELDAMFESDQTVDATRLGRFIRRIEQGWSPQCDSAPADDHEWGVTKVSAVRPGRFVASENKRLPDELTPQVEYEVKPGDLLITRANTPTLVGAFAVAPPDVRSKLIFSDKIMRVEVEASLARDYVALLGQTTFVRSILSGTSTGTSRSMVNIRGADIRDLRIVPRSAAQQAALVISRRRSAGRTQRTTNLLLSSIDRLTELKRSMITAAVTGEFDVSSADGSQVPVKPLSAEELVEHFRGLPPIDPVQFRADVDSMIDHSL